MPPALAVVQIIVGVVSNPYPALSRAKVPPKLEIVASKRVVLKDAL